MEVDQFCFEVQPGEGRLAKCLDDQLVEEGKPAYKGSKVSDGCKTELDTFKISRAENINKDVPLAEACVKVRFSLAELDGAHPASRGSATYARHPPAAGPICNKLQLAVPLSTLCSGQS